jgi:hypothetical protein
MIQSVLAERQLRSPTQNVRRGIEIGIRLFRKALRFRFDQVLAFSSSGPRPNIQDMPDMFRIPTDITQTAKLRNRR